MFPLYNIVSDIIASVVVCVDFLGTHITSLVLFFRTGSDMPPQNKKKHNKSNVGERGRRHRTLIHISSDENKDVASLTNSIM